MRLVEPDAETYAIWVNEKDFSVFDLFYTEAGYKIISGEPLKSFANHYGYFIIDRKDKTVSFMQTLIYSEYQ